jgi:hypothetical protein
VTPEQLAALVEHPEATAKARFYLGLAADVDGLDLARHLAWIADELPADTAHGLQKAIRRIVAEIEDRAGVA